MARETQGSPVNERKLEQYGVWVKVKPRDVTTAPVLEESFALSDLEAPKTSSRKDPVPDQSALTDEEEKLLDELETELDPDASAAIPVPGEEPLLDDAELPDIETARERVGDSGLELRDALEEELPELEEEDLEPAPRARARATGGGSRASPPAEVEVTLSEGGGEEDRFDDLAALESELASVTTKTRGASNSSAEILARIEDELKSIRTDLNQLRHDLSGLRKTAAEGGAAGPSSASGAQSGFFDEDEDETIALTGDELDNILNTAEITEESAEAPGAAADMDLMVANEGGFDAADGTSDILGYETPAPEAVEMPMAENDLEILEAPLADEMMVLSDDDLLPTDATHDGPGASVEDLPADLVLEELPQDSDTSSDFPGSADLPELDLEGIPEMESEPEIAPAPRIQSAMDDDGSETIDLETLDLGEEPKVIDAVPEQVEEIEELQDAEDLLGDDSSPAARPKGTSQPDPGPADEVDLEALAAEAEELEDNLPVAPTVEDLDIGELEGLSDEAGEGGLPQKEIEISFEGDLAEDVEALQESVESGVHSEEIEEAEEVTEAGPAGIPDNLKDEIRTVLKYMDHLLEALPDEKIQEFASSDYFVMYKKLFEDLGLGE